MREKMGGFRQQKASTQPMGTPDPFSNLEDSASGDDPFAGAGQPWQGGEQGFSYPGQESMDDIAALLQDWMTGGMVQEPGAWGEALGFLRPMAKSGRPVDVSGLFDAMTPVSNRYLEDTAKDLAEQFGVGGLRWSTPLQSGITRETQRMAENMGLAQTQAEIQAQENAMARILGATQQMGGIGGMQGQFGLGEAGLRQGAANAGFNIANTQAMMPMMIAQGMMGLQGQMEGFQNQALGGQQMDPFLALAMQLAGLNPSTYAPKGPSGFEQVANIGMDWLPGFLANLNKGRNTPVPPANYWGDLQNKAPGYFKNQPWTG